MQVISSYVDDDDDDDDGEEGEEEEEEEAVCFRDLCGALFISQCP
jgi:hypothetical protein